MVTEKNFRLFCYAVSDVTDWVIAKKLEIHCSKFNKCGILISRFFCVNTNISQWNPNRISLKSLNLNEKVFQKLRREGARRLGF